MIQDFSLNIKKAFQSYDFRFFNEPPLSQIEAIELYCLNNMEASSIHTHHGSPCRSSQLVYFSRYSRHYVHFDHDVHDDMISIPVLLCRNDGHHHAILPSPILVPYSSFSIFFMLRVLFMKDFTSATVGRITETFQISVSTLYRWMKRYHAYLRVFNLLRNRYHMHFFIHVIYDFFDLINDIFETDLHTLFQYDRILSHHDP